MRKILEKSGERLHLRQPRGVPIEFETDWEEWRTWCEETSPVTDEVLDSMADYYEAIEIKGAVK